MRASASTDASSCSNKSHFASLKKSNGNTVAEQHAIAGDRRKLGTRHQDASEVQRVSAGE